MPSGNGVYMDFRRAVPSDTADIAALEELIFPDPWNERSIQDCICTDGAMCFCCIENGKAVAYLLGRLIAPEGEIYRVAVHPNYRHKYIGYRLLDYSVKTSKGRGLEVIFLEVRSQNFPAIKLYASYGFKEAGRRKNYYKNPQDDAIIMLKASKCDILDS